MIYKPITEQWPIMLAYITLIGGTSLLRNPMPRLFIIFFQAYVLATMVYWTGKRCVKAFAYLVIYLLFTIEIGLEKLFGMYISPATLMLLVETNMRESTEFMRVLLAKPEIKGLTMGFALIVMANFLVERYRLTINHHLAKHREFIKTGRYTTLILIFSGFVFHAEYITLFSCDEVNDVDEWRSHMRNPNDILTKTIISLWVLHLSEKEMVNVIIKTESMKSEVQIKNNDSLVVVFVIGESYIRNHSALYGYPLQTTPFLSHEQENGQLFVFSDVVSPYNQTTKVIRNTLSCNSIGEGERWTSTPPLTAIFKKNGYHVSFFDNQKDFCFGTLFLFSLNTYLYHPKMLKECYDETNDTTFEFDGQLVDYFFNNYEKRKQNQLVVFHLLGQHFVFKDRYPKDFKYYNVDSTAFRNDTWLTKQMREEIANYDNATRYNDKVLKKIMDYYRNDNMVLIYFSDHGEEVYDYRASIGRDAFEYGDNFKEGLHWQYDVPFMVWCSRKYMTLYPENIRALRIARERPLSLDNTCHLLFHLSGLNTSYYKTSRDILSKDYAQPLRLINDKIDYDKYK